MVRETGRVNILRIQERIVCLCARVKYLALRRLARRRLPSRTQPFVRYKTEKSSEFTRFVLRGAIRVQASQGRLSNPQHREN
jgi:hypothetical protein